MDELHENFNTFFKPIIHIYNEENEDNNNPYIACNNEVKEVDNKVKEVDNKEVKTKKKSVFQRIRNTYQNMTSFNEDDDEDDTEKDNKYYMSNLFLFLAVGLFFIFVLDTVCNILKNQFVDIIKIKELLLQKQKNN
jgi:hypothetical protein